MIRVYTELNQRVRTMSMLCSDVKASQFSSNNNVPEAPRERHNRRCSITFDLRVDF